MARVLVVDDNAPNRQLLRAYLESAGHEVIEAESGERAVEVAQTVLPDLVLLDVMMPGMNGFQTTTELKELANGFLPVILVTALNDASSKLLGLRVGADDFVTKPVDRFEILARAGNLLKLQTNQRELDDRNRRLVELQQFRAEMTSLIVHDLKNPLSVVMSNLDYAIEDPRLAELPDVHDAIVDARSGARRALRLLANLADVERLEANRLVLTRVATTVRALVEPIVEQRERAFAARGVRVDLVLPELIVDGDVDLLTRAIENVLDNALRYVPAAGSISVSASADDERTVSIAIGNSGQAVPPAAREHIFEKYGQSGEHRRMNLGLGLYFCRMVAEAHGGTVRVGEAPGLPTVFTFSLPRSLH